MGRFDNLPDWADQANSPAAPSGLRQTAEHDGRFDQLPAWADQPGGYAANPQGWYTGANHAGEQNGWDTDFMRRTQEQYDTFAAEGKLNQQFEQPHATGIVTWDHTSSDGKKNFNFGDIFDNGKRVGNVYDQFKDQPGTADLMMAQLLYDGTQQARLFSGDNPMAGLKEAVAKTREENNANAAKALGAADFQAKTTERAASIEEGKSGAALVAGGAAAGAATFGAAGAAVGSVVPGIGTGIVGGTAAVVGGIAGGIGAYLNKDELSEQAARAYEITALADREFGTREAITTGLSQWSGFAQSLSSPLTNLEHGSVELTGDNKVGDHKVAYYAQDKTGKYDRPLWAKPLSLAASIGDGVAQFISPLGRGVYMTEMGGQIAGESAMLAQTGSMFDPRRGDFNNIFVDDKGHASPVAAAAGIMNIGIDAVQMVGFKGLANQFGRAGAAVKAGEREAEAAGFKFALDESGKAVSKRATLAILAPSEQIAYANATRAARVAAMKDGRTATADDFYKAATRLNNGSSKLKAALVNGFGEGYEELAQGLLEPIAQGGAINVSDLMDSFLQGAAGGVGMSLGATFAGPTNDARMKNQAYFLETLRRGGTEPGAEFDKQWADLNETQKRMMASRSEADTKVTADALQKLSKSQAATLVASSEDMAKAMNARLTQSAKELNSATSKTDAFHVIGGILDSRETSRGEAVTAGAQTIARLLEDRLRGLDVQEQTLADRIAQYGADPERAELVAEAQSLLANVQLSKLVGADIVAAVNDQVDAIYDPNTTAADAARFTRDLSRALEKWFDRSANVVAPVDADGKPLTAVPAGELKDAAAQFVTLLHSREPKLDSGSYVALLPQASWSLTQDGAENLLQVNSDILQSINGDFDGDKLRSEYQLILPPERFLQARAGQNLAGRGESIDIATRNFDAALVEAIGSSLAATGQLRREARGVLQRIEDAVTARYGSLMSPAALARVLVEFRTAVRAGNEEARTTLLDGLAREAGEAITDHGRGTLTNEWLWISRVVRSNFEEFQTSYRKLRARGSEPSDTEVVADIDTPEGVNRRKAAAVNDAQTLALFAVGNSLFRKFQAIHYTSYNSSVLNAAGIEHVDLYDMAAFYEELSRGVTRSELSRTETGDSISGRVLVMLDRLVSEALRDPDLAGQFSPATAMTLLANVKVKDVWWGSDGAPVTDGKDISLAQLLLKRALDADREEHVKTFDGDEKLKARHNKLRALTVANDVAGDINAERAFLEIFGAVPFRDSLGGVVGALAPNTTPEQWLRSYISLDSDGRRDMERLFTNVPEYLNRDESSNLPYSMAEMRRRAITPYRSMLDALLAVGRSELTFNPETSMKDAGKAFGGRIAKQNQAAIDDFTAGHTAVREALASFRDTTNRRSGKRADRVEHVRQLFAENPQFARQVLELIPDAAANAVFEWRDGQLYTATWVYEMFAIEDSAEAVFHYWKNLTLARWAATEVTVFEDDADAKGRQYHKLQSRFQRVLYQFAREPGQPHMELLVRKLDEFKNLDQFFLWLNKAPGMRGQQAPLLPFVDDVSDFEADAAGGWSTQRASGDIRLAIQAMRRGAEQLRETAMLREAQEATDSEIHAGIQRAFNNDPQATPQDYDDLRRLERAVQVSIELPRGFAPTAMLALTRGATRGFDPHSTDKGVTADSYLGLGEMQALMDAFGFVPGLERVMETLTAHSVNSLAMNAGDLSKHAGTAMTADGQVVDWQQMTTGQAIEMLGDPRTRPLAYLLLTPRALDVAPNGLTERTLVPTTLKDLLDDGHYKGLFRLEGEGALDRAMRYLSFVDARARAEGGNFDVIRYVNTLVITRLSGLTRPLADTEQIVNQAYLDAAKAIQLKGQILASKTMRDAGTMDNLRKATVKVMREKRKSRTLAGFADIESGNVTEEWVKRYLKDLKTEERQLRKEMAKKYKGDELARRVARLTAQYQANADRIQHAMADDPTGLIEDRFAITGDPVSDSMAKAQVIEYVRTMSSFPARAPESAELWSYLVGELEGGRTPDDSFDWDQLSRSAMGVYLADEVQRVSSHVSIPPFPKTDPTAPESRNRKYIDPSFSYLATELLQDDAVGAAAVWMHTLAEQPVSPTAVQDLTRTLEHTVLNDQSLGTWTPGLYSQLTETLSRMDSAAAGQAVAAAGNGPKRWAAILKATRRNGRLVPGADLVTTAGFSGDLLAEAASPFNEILVTPAGHTEQTAMPVAQLDNRFVRALRVNGQDIALDAWNLGFSWQGETQPTGYRYVSLPRLREVLTRLAKSNNQKLSDLAVEVDFLHPDSRPAGKEWANSVYFDGMAHSLLPDGSESLLATLWSDNGGQISVDTQRPLDSSKKGHRAIQPFKRVDEAAHAAAEELWITGADLAGLLRRKTELAMTYDDGTGSLEISDYNAMYKALALQHIVVGRRDGKPAAMTADEVIAHQAANGRSAPLPLDGARLVKLSPDVLRTMLGETGDQGVPRFFDDEYLLNPDLVVEYTGITEAMLERFADGWLADTGSLADTSLVNASAARVLTVRSLQTDAERSAREERVRFLNERNDKILTRRSQKLDKADVRKGYVAALQLAIGSVGTERNTFDFMGMGVDIAPRNVHEANHTVRLLEAKRAIDNRESYERGWQVVDQGNADVPGGMLTVESLDNDRPLQDQIAPRDVALVALNTFQRPERDITQVTDRVEKALKYLVNTGSTIVLGPGNGTGDIRYESSQFLLEHGYVPVAGSKHMYAPAGLVEQTQNERAYASTLTETRTTRPANNILTLLAIDPIGADENTAALNPRSRKLRDRKLVNNLLPSSMYPHYNLPVDDGLDGGPYSRVLAHLRTVMDPTNADARAALLKMGGPDLDRLMPLEAALDRFFDKITNTATLAPQPGETIEVGDIIPFVHPDGRVVLYRHGLKAPRPHELRALQDESAINVALAKSESERASTANTGVITEVEPRAGFGRTLAIEVPLQPYGDKVQLEWNGMKYVVVPAPEGGILSRLFQAPVFANGTLIDLISDLKSANSKEAYEGRIHNYRNALAFFQFDFLPDLTEFFFPGKGQDSQSQVLTYSLLKRLQKQDDARIPLADANAIAKSNVAVADLLGAFAAMEADRGLSADWVDKLVDPGTANQQIAKAVITYLLTPGAHVDNVLRSAGFSHPQAGNETVSTRLVPGLFADLLDNGPGSALHAELISRFDRQLARSSSGAGLKLHTDWTVEAFDGTGESLRAYLQFGQAVSSGDNPELNGQAYDVNEKATVSAHNALAAASSIGAITGHKLLAKSRAFARSFIRGNGVAKFGEEGDSMWEMLTTLPDESDTSLAGWRRELPAETARRMLARREIAGLYHPLITDGWSEQERADYDDAAISILNELNLYDSQGAMVDTWVRQQLGRPHELDELGNPRGVVSGRDAVEAAVGIRDQLVRKGLLPTAGAAIPLLDVNHLTTIYMANVNLPDGKRWSPLTTTDATGPRASSWDAWVETAFGTAWIMPEDGGTEVVPEPDFHQMFALSVDGLMHGYQGATSSTRYLPVAADILRQRQLMDPQTNRMFVSVFADENLLATDPTLFHSSMASLEQIMGGPKIYADGRDGPDPVSAKGRAVQRRAAWQREVEAPRQAGAKLRGVRAQGQTFLGYTTSTSGFWRSMFNLRVGNAMLNPILVVSAPLEAFYRRTINLFSNAVSGEATGAVGKTQTRILDSFADTKIGAVGAQLGLSTTWTMEQHKQIDDLVHALSTLPEFKALVYRELMFNYPSMPGIGHLEKWLEKYARFGARIQDPSWGMLPHDLARIYVETALTKIAHDPTGEKVYGVDRMLTELSRNPDWLKTADLETHNMAISRLANMRSVKASVLSLGLRGVVEPMAANPKFLVNSTGNMLKMLTAFQNFWSNSVINMAGLQGPADFAAFWFDGRRKSKLTRRMQSALAGTPFQPEAEEFYDMSEVLESMDLADSFIRSGITHTGLFTLGLLANGLGLSGEDDEEKFRRRQAELQGAGLIHDPRKVQNDFRNKGALFLDWLPMGLDGLFKADPNNPDSRAMVQMNFVTRYFLSPVIGFERFYQNGDVNEIMHGFGDALGAHPIVNAQLWNEFSQTAAELHQQSNAAAEAGDHQQSAHLMVTLVGMGERMLMENAFVNALYIGADRYDRDPYVLPKTDSDGNQQLDVRGNPYKNEQLQEFINDNGEVQQGYVSRDDKGALVRTFTENRFGLAMAGSIFSGLTGGSFGGSDLWRSNMAVKQREFDLMPTDQKELEADLLAAFQGQQAKAGAQVQVGLTQGEAAQRIKNWYQDHNIYWDADTVEKQAAQLAAQTNLPALSITDAAGEHLTDVGARGIFDGLRHGSMALSDAALNGVYITKEQRGKIRDDLAVQLTQEGVDLGLSRDQAEWRMRRIMFGTNAPEGAPKLIDLIYTDQIPWTQTLRYNQLNTSYAIGPDGMPWATGFQRPGLMGALGLAPVTKQWGAQTGTGQDSLVNTVDQVAGVNVGLRALERRPDSWEIPSIEDVTKQAAKDIIDAIKGIDFSPTPSYKKNGTGYGHYYRRGYGHGGYGGGGGYSGYSDFQRMYNLPGGQTPYGNSIPFINTSNPIIRRADVRRERVWSERGRLKQWQ